VPNVSTDAGMQIVSSDEHPEKTDLSMQIRVDPDSNLTVESRAQLKKHPTPNLSTDVGMQIVSSD
jgi:hypothetical protein